MLFGRRRTPALAERVRLAVWPRRSWGRSLRYGVLRLQRLDCSAHALGLGLAIGVFAAFQPFLGCQMLFAGGLAWLLGASVSAALLGTFVGGPMTWPAMWFASYELGALILGEVQAVTVADLVRAIAGLGAAASPAGAANTALAGSWFWHILYPLSIGAVLLGVAAGGAVYAVVMRVAAPGVARR